MTFPPRTRLHMAYRFLKKCRTFDHMSQKVRPVEQGYVMNTKKHLKIRHTFTLALLYNDSQALQPNPFLSKVKQTWHFNTETGNLL